jgi:GTPase
MQVGPEEIEEGNIEYKRYFYNLTDSRINHLAAQMNWRINEGNGICNYYLGVCDDGTIFEDFTQERMDYTIDMIKIMVNICNSYIDNIMINRYQDYIWLNVSIKRKKEFLREYRILVLTDIIKPIFNESNINYIESNKSIYYNTYIHNNDKYLFFEVSSKKIKKILKLMDFNLIINDKLNINNITLLINYIDNNMRGNKEYNDDFIIFNTIKKINIPSVGIILFGFLKQGSIKVGHDLILREARENNNLEKKYNILSIHNNMIDCNEARGPATISIKVKCVMGLTSLLI